MLLFEDLFNIQMASIDSSVSSTLAAFYNFKFSFISRYFLIPLVIYYLTHLVNISVFNFHIF